MSMLSKGTAGARRLRRGLTLVESAMVLAILGLVIAGALLLYQNASTNNKISEASQQLAAVSQAVRQVYAGQATYTGLANLNIVNSLPKKMLVGTDGLRHAFNGNLTVESADSGQTFIVTMTGLPQEGCVALATKDFGRAVQEVKIGSTTAAQGAMTPTQAQTACASSLNEIEWKLL